MEVAGVKRVLFKIILPAGLLAAWMLTCYPVCNKADGFDVFLYWILVGCPYGLRKMCMILVPKNFGIAGSMGILALNCVVGGLIGGVVAIWRMVTVLAEIIKVIRDYFWTRCPKVHEMTDNKKALFIESNNTFNPYPERIPLYPQSGSRVSGKACLR